jgi:hypothetical protein
MEQVSHFCYGDKIKEISIGWTCSSDVGDKKHIEL